MKTWLAITDLTRMQGRRVCLAGYTADLTCVRPLFPRPKGLTEEWLQANRHGIIRPFAVVEFDLQQAAPDPPHTEDWIISPVYRVRRVLAPDGQKSLLERIVDDSVESIFGAAIHYEVSHYVHAGEGSRSLGTVRPGEVVEVSYKPKAEGKWDYRMSFTDGAGETYRLAVTDLAFRYCLDHLRTCEGMTPRGVEDRLMSILADAQVFLRIGLARGWDRHPDRCHLQITGVHTFPDYLGGRCYADLAPQEAASHTEEEIPF